MFSKDGSKFWSSQTWQHFLTQTKHFAPMCTKKEVTIPTVMYVKITEHSFPIPHMLSLSYKYHIYGGQSEQYLGWDEIQINSMFRNGECFIMSVASASYTYCQYICVCKYRLIFLCALLWKKIPFMYSKISWLARPF